MGQTACCTDQCIGGKKRCLADGGLSTCSTTSNGCIDWTTSSCGAGEYCPSGWNACVDAGTVPDAGCTPQYEQWTGCKPCCTGLSPTSKGWCAPTGCVEFGNACSSASDCCNTEVTVDPNACSTGFCKVDTLVGDPCSGAPGSCGNGSSLMCWGGSVQMCRPMSASGDACHEWHWGNTTPTLSCLPGLYCDVTKTCTCDP